MSFCIVASSAATPENVTKLSELFRNETIPALSKRPGLKSAYFMTKETGEVLIFQVWESESQFKEWTKCAEHDDIEHKAAGLRTEGFKIENYGIRIHENVQRF